MSIAMAARPLETLPQGALRLTRGSLASAQLITARGELDAQTARTLVDVVDDVARSHTALIVDLGPLAFFGTEGLWALNRIRAACAKHHVSVAIVAGPEVRRVLRVCDPHGALGVVTTLDDAASALTVGASGCSAPAL
ncbi:STAS domain-containing protein [Mycolicibacterium sediminis]|uniref:STAS domain-containing protein n=1 Tax=Mycolicibacterium sediminis TaxID=1286180 RepID=UPI0013D70A71|nr:STAS domain-containing protein [Mycolicibacterium sediminis]